MISTRDRILQVLLNNPNSTINDLAEAVGINPISVRHHLTALQVEGSVQAVEERHGVGRPRLAYSLTDSGVEKFPTRYLNLTNLLLAQLKSRLPKTDFEDLFRNIGREMTAQLPPRVRSKTLEERLDILAAYLTQQGFTLNWSRKGDNYEIIELTCPFFHIGKHHPEVCAIDQTLISTVLAAPVRKVQCLVDGDFQCSYILEPSKMEN